MQTLLGIVCAIGAVQGLFLALLLATLRHGNVRANRWLAAFVAAFSLLSLSDALMITRWILLVPQLGYLFDWLVLALGPLMLRYVDELIGRRHARRWLLHLLPALLVWLLFLPTMLLPAAEKRAALEADLIAAGAGTDPVLVVAALLALAYLITGIYRLVQHERALTQGHSRLETRTLLWLRHLLGVLCVLWVIWSYAIVSGGDWVSALDLITFPVTVYVLGYFALRQPELLLDPAVLPPAPIAAPATDEEPPYSRSGLNDERATAIGKRLDAVMAMEKPWLENDLTLTQLATRIDATPKHLSQVLNERLGKTFFDYINEYRVSEVQRCLADPAYAGQPILEIALAAGFNSKASFNAVFRRYTGMTPSEYRRRAGKPDQVQT